MRILPFRKKIPNSRKPTGTRLHAPFPAGVINDVNYGASVKALAFLLNNYYDVSIAKTKQCISDITKGIVNLSTGTICNLCSEFSASTEAERARIFSRLVHSNVLYSDATVSNINGNRKTVILCTNKEQVLYQHVDHKGHDGLSQTPVNHFNKTIVHDHDRTYYSYGNSHQECIAHVLRYLIAAMENEPSLTWHKQMHELLQKISTRKRIHGWLQSSKETTPITFLSVDYANLKENKNKLLCFEVLPADNIFVMHLPSLRQPEYNIKMCMTQSNPPS